MTKYISHMTNFVSRRWLVLELLMKSPVKEKVLLYIYTHGESYAREIARELGLYVRGIQHHLLKMEQDGILYSKLKGKVRLFGIEPRYPFKKELEAVLDKTLLFVPEEERKRLYTPRLRPRRTGKPL